MEPQPGIPTLKRIYEAEREADRIVRGAEAEAEALLRRADADASALLDERRRLLPLRRAAALEEAIASIERDAATLLEGEKARMDERARKWTAGVERIVDGLLEMVLPS